MERVIFDYSRLKGRIYEVFGSQRKFADAMGMNRTSMWAKLTNRTYFNQAEIVRAASLLGIAPGAGDAYFFTLKL